MSGIFTVVIFVLGVLSWIFLLYRISLSWLFWVIITLVFSVLSLALFLWYFYAVLSPWPDKFPNEVIFWGGIFWWALCLTIVKFFYINFKQKCLVSLALLLILCLSATKINIIYAAYPDVASILGVGRVPKEPIDNYVAKGDAFFETEPVSKRWDFRKLDSFSGSIAKALIPGEVSNFVARDAYFYFPAIYSLKDSPRLPVLILIAGQPGGPEDWIPAGKIQNIMDDFAKKNNGLAPVVVIPDVLGESSRNTLCVDSPLGNVDTYVSTDIPNWISDNLNVDLNKQHWLIGGYSFGGTCSLQFAVNHPEEYPNFVNIAGQPEPTVGSKEKTLELFNNSVADFEKVNPANLMRKNKFYDTSGFFVAGQKDSVLGPPMRETVELAKAAGMDVKFEVLDQHHSWTLAIAGLSLGLDWFKTKLGFSE